MTIRRLAASMLATIALVSGCSREEPQEPGAPMDFHGEEAGTTAQRPEDTMPYGEAYTAMTNQPPEVVATTAITRLAEATAQEVDAGTAVARLNGVTTPELWARLSSDPYSVTPHAAGPLWRAWADAGGTQTADVAISGEQHPEDTEDSWQRKLAVTRTLDGQDVQMHDTYVVACEKRSGQWRVADLQLLSTTATTPTVEAK